MSAPREACDYAVVGGGPAGLAVGIEAALAGRSAIVIERRAGALDKGCGEGLMPLAVARLGSMGVGLPPGGFHPFRGIRYVDGDLVAEAAFRNGPGRGVRRTVLSEAMLARAAALGVDVRLGVEAAGFVEGERGVRLETNAGPIEARWLVGADGLHGTVRRAPGFEVLAGRRRRFGVRRHIAVAPWSDCVEVHWQDGVEAYVTPVSATEVGVAFLWTPDDDADSGWDRFLDRFPALAARLGPAARGGARGTRGAGPFAVAVRPAARGRVLLAGDASGYVDAITGEGIGLAFAAAQALVRATGPDDDARPHAAARRYARALRRLRRRHEWLTRVLLTVAGRPALRRRYVAALAASPRAFGGLLALSSGACGWGRALPSLAALAARTVIPGARSAPPRPAPAPRRAAG